MALINGVLPFSANFHVKYAGRFDGLEVDTLADLSNVSTFDGYQYLNMIVSVKNDGANNGNYQLTALPHTVAGNWSKIGGDIEICAIGDVQSATPTENTKATSALRAWQGFVYWATNTPFAGLNTVSKTILGAINELAANTLKGNTTTHTTPIGADSVGVWDSVANAFKRLSLTNLRTFVLTALNNSQVANISTNLTGSTVKDVFDNAISPTLETEIIETDEVLGRTTLGFIRFSFVTLKNWIKSWLDSADIADAAYGNGGTVAASILQNKNRLDNLDISEDDVYVVNTIQQLSAAADADKESVVIILGQNITVPESGIVGLRARNIQVLGDFALILPDVAEGTEGIFFLAGNTERVYKVSWQAKIIAGENQSLLFSTKGDWYFADIELTAGNTAVTFSGTPTNPNTIRLSGNRAITNASPAVLTITQDVPDETSANIALLQERVERLTSRVHACSDTIEKTREILSTDNLIKGEFRAVTTRNAVLDLSQPMRAHTFVQGVPSTAEVLNINLNGKFVYIMQSVYASTINITGSGTLSLASCEAQTVTFTGTGAVTVRVASRKCRFFAPANINVIIGGINLYPQPFRVNEVRPIVVAGDLFPAYRSISETEGGGLTIRLVYTLTYNEPAKEYPLYPETTNRLANFFSFEDTITFVSGVNHYPTDRVMTLNDFNGAGENVFLSLQGSEVGHRNMYKNNKGSGSVLYYGNNNKATPLTDFKASFASKGAGTAGQHHVHCLTIVGTITEFINPVPEQ